MDLINTSAGGPLDEALTARMPRSASLIFRRTLVTGASVSADWSTISPGKRLGWRHGGESSVVTVAQGGKQGREMIRHLHPKIVEGRSVIVAIDFLFWDSTLADPRESLRALQSLVGLARGEGIPLVLGDIPELIPGLQPGRAALNEAIRESCDPARGCHVVGLERLHRQVITEGLVIDGKRRMLRELVPDGLHLSEAAGEFLAEQVQAAVEEGLKGG